MNARTRTILICVAALFISIASFLAGRSAQVRATNDVAVVRKLQEIPDKEFSRSPKEPHDSASFVFRFDQLDHYYRVPGEFTHRLVGDKYGFEALSVFISETHPGGGPNLHVHDVEEAHVLLEGSAQYRIGDQTLTVQAPYVAKVPAGVPHTFINAGTEPFNLVAVFASKLPTSKRIGPNPLIPKPQNGNVPPSHTPPE